LRRHRRHRQHRLHGRFPAGMSRSVKTHYRVAASRVLTIPTVLTALSGLLFTLIVLVPARPSRENVISMPRVRRNVCVRRNRPASARGFFAHDGPLELSARAFSTHKCMRSDALPAQMVRSAIIVRTQVAKGSASMMLSMLAVRFAA